MIPTPPQNAALLQERRHAALATPSHLPPGVSSALGMSFTVLLADVFALYLKTKNFHWHVSGPQFRDLHRLFDEQGAELIAITDPLAERCRAIGASTLRSIGHIARLQNLLDNEAEYVEPQAMLAELRDDNLRLAGLLRAAHDLCTEHRDIAGADAIGRWLGEAERRTWFLFEASRGGSDTSRRTLAN